MFSEDNIEVLKVKVLKINRTNKSMELDSFRDQDSEAISIRARLSGELVRKIELEVTKKGKERDFPHFTSAIAVLSIKAFQTPSTLIQSDV